MISYRVGLLAWTIFVGACAKGTEAEAPAPLQGVVEHDERLLAFEVGGKVAEVTAERGDAVVAGRPLARLDDGLERPVRDLRAAEVALAQAQLALLEAGPRAEEIRAARAELGAVMTQRDLAERSLERQLALASQGATPATRREEIDTQLAALDGRRTGLQQQLLMLRRGARSQEIDAAEARLAAATAGLAATDARLARYALTTPAAGTVTDRHVEVGEVVAPGAPAFSVADLDHPYVDVFVPESRMRTVRIGMAARVRSDGLPRELSGRVEHVSNRTEFTPRFLFSEDERPNLVLRVRVRVEDPTHQLHAGVPAFVTLAGQP